jgi:hypothetical protein
LAWAGNGSLPAAGGLDASVLDDPTSGIHYETSESMFGSLHAGNIVQFCFVDGAVKPLRKDIELRVFYALATMHGEEVIGKVND